jgi:hypothetical protein
MDVLAEKLIPWEPMNHEQRLALLTNRTKPAGALDSRVETGSDRAFRRARSFAMRFDSGVDDHGSLVIIGN